MVPNSVGMMELGRVLAVGDKTFPDETVLVLSVEPEWVVVCQRQEK